MPFDLRDHTADVAVEATGGDLDEVFGAVADGLAGCMYDGDLPATGDRFDLAVEAEGLEALLFDYLDRLIYERDVRDVLPVGNRVEVDAGGARPSLSASARGVPLASIAAREVKAVTYSDMVLERDDGGWRAYVVFDV